MPGQLIRLLHTARHLRVQQMRSRVRQRVLRVLPDASRHGAEDGLEFPGCRWSQGKDLLPPAAVGIQAAAVERGALRFLNTTCEIGFPPCWEPAGPSRLWLYNLHYFDWLWSLDFAAAKAVVRDWLARHDNRRGRVGWEPYPISVRLINWCGFFFGRHHGRMQNDGEFCRVLWRSIYRQCEWLSRHLETHLLNNHYLENGAALAFAGSCFAGDQARRWCDCGMRILAEQLAEQVLPDGMHFELSPMYHGRVLYVLCLLLETEVPAIVDLVAEPVRRMARAVGRLCHPDGDIALLSDSAHGVCHAPRELLAYALRHTPPLCAEDDCGSFALPDAGYYGWQGRDGSYLIADFGKIGPDHNPGHGHADIFSFELSLNGCRVITDSGVHDYEPSAERQYCRSTAAHNTVQIEGQDQCELWDAFRVARRGYPHNVQWRCDDRGFALEGRHDGYARLPGKPMHQRQMRWDSATGLVLCDTVTAGRSIRGVSRLHLHPTCRIVAKEPRSVRVSYPKGEFNVEAYGDMAVEETAYFARFYEPQSRPCLCLIGRGHRVELQYRITM